MGQAGLLLFVNYEVFVLLWLTFEGVLNIPTISILSIAPFAGRSLVIRVHCEAKHVVAGSRSVFARWGSGRSKLGQFTRVVCHRGWAG